MFAVALSTGSTFATGRGDAYCGDLEDRIAELEATTSTKGNRKMSLTISGQADRLIMWWDDGRSSSPTGQYYAMVWGFIIDAAQRFNRTELVRYDSPTWHGFIYSAGIAEAGNYWSAMVRYAGEHAGFRVAAQIGYERITDAASPGVIDLANIAYVGNPPNIKEAGANLSALHKSTGLFAQGC